MKLTFIPISALLALSIYFAAQTGRKPISVVLLLAACVAFFINEAALRRFHPEYNIRIDLLLLIPLGLVAFSKLAFPKELASERTPANHLASSSLTFALIGLLFWMLPVLGAAAVFKGHQALRCGLSGTHQTKAVLGLLLGYGQIAGAIYLWFLY